MMSYMMRTGAVVMLLFSLVMAPAAHAAEGDHGPVQEWFAGQAAAQVSAVEAPWLTELLADTTGTLAFGEPVPLVGIRPPQYDLARDRPTGDASLEAALDRSGSEYCARGTVDGSPVAMVACGQVDDEGHVRLTGFGQVGFLDTSAAALPAGGITETRGGWLGITTGEQPLIVALDAAAAEWIGAQSVDAAVIVRALAKQKAEYDAVSRMDGPVDGGAMPLFEIDDDWQQQVSRAVALDTDPVLDTDPAPTKQTARSASWLLVVGIIIVVAAVWIVLRRSRRRARNDANQPIPAK